jgi:hypothetical protein
MPQVLVGHPDYEVTGGSATYKGEDLFELEPEKRSHMGLFLRCAKMPRLALLGRVGRQSRTEHSNQLLKPCRCDSDALLAQTCRCSYPACRRVLLLQFPVTG